MPYQKLAITEMKMIGIDIIEVSRIKKALKRAFFIYLILILKGEVHASNKFRTIKFS